MQGNSGFSKIIRTKPQSQTYRGIAHATGPKWKRTDKRAAYAGGK